MRLVLKAIAWVLALLVVTAGALLPAYRVPDRSAAELAKRWAPPPSQFVLVDGLTVHLRDEGPRDDALPIVLLHGTAASLHTWDGWVAALKDRHRVLRYDMPGFGLTGPAPDHDYRIERYVRTLIAVLDRAGIRRCILAGNSLGGNVAWAAAVLHPERVARLVLVDAGGYPFASASVPLAFTIARTPVLGPLMRDVLPRPLVESSVRNVFGDPSKVTPDLVDRYFDLATRAGNRDALAERFRQTQPGAMAQRVAEIRVPTLILWGGRDRLIPPELAERFHRDIAGSRLERFDELGHVPQEEDPARTVQAVQNFLAGT